MRNWRVRNLRAFAALSHHLDRDLGDGVRALVDEQLTRMGAATIAEHRAAQVAKSPTMHDVTPPAESASDADDDTIPLPF
jgi:hypothetical protein